MKSPDSIQHFRINWLLAIALMLTPFFPYAQQVSTESDGTTSVSINHSNDGRQKITIKRNGVNFDVEYDGYVTLSDDDKDVVAISAGGYLKISKSAFGSKRRIAIEADRSGQLIKKYYVGWSEKPFQPDGQAWLAEVLPEIIRSSGLGAEDRTDRIYTRGGMDAFAREVRRLESDYVKSIYLKLILCKALNSTELRQVVSLMDTEIKSDYYLSSLLIDNYEVLLGDASRLDAFVSATRKIESDHYITEVLKTVIASPKVSDQQLGKLMAAAASIQSDHYRSSVLIDMMRQRKLDGQALGTLIQLSRDIESDHYLSEVLRDAIQQETLDDQAFDQLVGVLDRVQSDHYITEVVKSMSDDQISTSVLAKLLNVIKNEIQSDHYQAESLKHILRKQKLEGASYGAFLEAARSINSDNYAAEVMRETAKVMVLTDSQLIDLLNSCSSIDSDHYLTETLLAFASQVNRRGGAVKEAYLNAAKSIGSETYYGRAAKAVN